MNHLLSWLGQLVLLILATFFFVVLYAHGLSNFPQNTNAEFRDLTNWISGGNPSQIVPSP